MRQLLLIAMFIFLPFTMAQASMVWTSSNDPYISDPNYGVELFTSEGHYVFADGTDCKVLATRPSYSGNFNVNMDCPEATGGDSTPSTQNGATVTNSNGNK